LNEPGFPADQLWPAYQKALIAPAGGAMETLRRAIELSLGSRHPSGLVLDADNSLGITTTALMENGYEVLSLAPFPASKPSLDAALVADYGERLCIKDCAFGTPPDGINEAPDAVVAFSDALSTLLSVDDLANALRTFYTLLRPGGTLVLAHADYDKIYATDPDSAVSEPVLTGDSTSPSVFLERRLWNGNPRSRLYTSEYILMSLTQKPAKSSVDRMALPMGQITDILREIGFQADTWKSPQETGFHRPLVMATKPPVPTIFFAPEPLDIPVRARLAPPPESAKTKFHFYPEDMDRNPFEEHPGDRKYAAPSVTADSDNAAPNRKQVTLVMLSGGIDSVYVLQRLLKESDDEIIAHHIHFVNRERRHKAEAIACKRIVSHLRETVRPFHYTESTIDRRRFEAFGMDDMCVGFEVGIVSNSFQINRGYPIDRWTSGTCLEEELEYYGSHELERFEHVLNSAAASSYPGQAPRYFQLKIIPKVQQLDYMGTDLVGLCWTCRTPVWNENGEPSECGTCKTCTLMARLRAGEETIAHKPSKLP